VGEEVDLTQYPRSYLLENPELAAWHNFGMEWKEHVAWMSPILATAVAYVVLRYGLRLSEAPEVRRAELIDVCQDRWAIEDCFAEAKGEVGSITTR
jgi:hypothetical protein